MKALRYGWIIVGVGLFVKMSALGFGRFAYSMLLPSMRDSLRFNYTQMGLLSGGILLGYLLFSFIGGILTTRFGSKRIVVTSLVCSSLSMFFLSRVSSFLLLLGFTFAMGGAAAGAHISMTTLPMSWFTKRRLGRALGIVTGGTGLGILTTGFLLPLLLTSLGKEAWRTCWVVMASITLAIAVAGSVLLKEKPGESGLPFVETMAPQEPLPNAGKGAMLNVRTIFAVYFVFGFSYIIYATYFVAFMIEGLHLNEKAAGDIWAVFGWTCMASGLIWGFLSDRVGRRRALLWNNGIISLAVFLPLSFQQPLFLAVSTFLFGLTFLGTVTIVAASIGDLVGERRASVYGLVTLIHGIGQLLGTTSGGYLKDLTGSFQVTFIASLARFLLCFFVIAFEKK